MSHTAFERFVHACQADLRRIARATRGEYEVGDVVSEAWLLAPAVGERTGMAVDLDAAAFRKALLAHLYQHLVRYTETAVRHAVRLDHAPEWADGESHPLLQTLACDTPDPLQALLSAESEVDEDATLRRDCSLAAAYVQLLQRCGNRMDRLAQHLLVSRSWAYRCCARARWLAVNQQPAALRVREPGNLPRPWRTERSVRSPVQLELDLEPVLAWG